MKDRPETGWVRVPLGWGCYLLLTSEEFMRGIKRGRKQKRIEAMVKRERESHE